MAEQLKAPSGTTGRRESAEIGACGWGRGGRGKGDKEKQRTSGIKKKHDDRQTRKHREPTELGKKTCLKTLLHNEMNEKRFIKTDTQKKRDAHNHVRKRQKKTDPQNVSL